MGYCSRTFYHHCLDDEIADSCHNTQGPILIMEVQQPAQTGRCWSHRVHLLFCFMNCIQTESGPVVTTPQEIHQVFGWTEILDDPAPEDQVQKALKWMKSGKAPGSDGCSVEYEVEELCWHTGTYFNTGLFRAHGNRSVSSYTQSSSNFSYPQHKKGPAWPNQLQACKSNRCWSHDINEDIGCVPGGHSAQRYTTTSGWMYKWELVLW